VKISIILYYYEKGFDYERLNFVKEDMADIPQSLYEAMKGILPVQGNTSSEVWSCSQA
jgi:hypothetical protein